MYMINLIIIYDVVKIFSMENCESLGKLRVGVNRYTGVNWSTTTTHGTRIIQVTYITNVPGSNGMKASTHGHLHTLQKSDI